MLIEKWMLGVYAIIILWIALLKLGRMGKLKGVEIYAFLLLLKTERGKDPIAKISRYSRLWKVFGSVAIVVGIAGMAFMSFFLIKNFYNLFYSKEVYVQPQALIPGVTVPFWYSIFGLVTLIIIHEISHGIIAKSEGISIKKLGLAFITIIPVGAFVEPDEDELKSKGLIPRLRVYSAGSFANLLVGFASLVLITPLFIAFFNTGALQITEVVKGSPADGILEKGMVLEEINGVKIQSIQNFSSAVKEIRPDSIVNIKTNKGTFNIKTVENPNNQSRGYIGIKNSFPVGEKTKKYLGTTLPWVIYFSLSWVSLLNINIGLINLAPLYFFVAATDGFLILKDTLSRFLREENAERITITISLFIMAILLFTLLQERILKFF